MKPQTLRRDGFVATATLVETVSPNDAEPPRPALEISVTGRASGIWRFAFPALRNGFAPAAVIRRPSGEAGDWENCGMVSFGYEQPFTDGVPSDAIVAACFDCALRIAREPPSEPWPTLALSTDGKRLIAVIAPVGNTGEFVELTLTPGGSLSVREFEANHSAHDGPFWYVRNRWLERQTIGTRRSLKRIFAMEPEAAYNALTEAFWTHVNEKLPDPFIHPENDTWRVPVDIAWIRGGEDELGRLLQIFAYTEPEGAFRFPNTVEIRTALRDWSAQLADDHAYSRRFARLVWLALAEHQPRGWTYEYNDGASQRRSGYDRRPHHIGFEIDAPSAHERLDATLALREWLTPRVSERERAELLGEAVV